MRDELQAVVVAIDEASVVKLSECLQRHAFTVRVITWKEWTKHQRLLDRAALVVLDEVPRGLDPDLVGDVEDCVCAGMEGPIVVVLEDNFDKHFDLRSHGHPRRIAHHNYMPLDALLDELSLACRHRQSMLLV